MRFRWSRDRFASIFKDQYPVFDFGLWAILHRWPCQKEPCTSPAFLCLGSTISGRPGRSFRWFLKRNPSLFNIDLTEFWLGIRSARSHEPRGQRPKPPKAWSKAASATVSARASCRVQPGHTLDSAPSFTSMILPVTQPEAGVAR
jgi:hypothetical protein